MYVSEFLAARVQRGRGRGRRGRRRGRRTSMLFRGGGYRYGRRRHYCGLHRIRVPNRRAYHRLCRRLWRPFDVRFGGRTQDGGVRVVRPPRRATVHHHHQRQVGYTAGGQIAVVGHAVAVYRRFFRYNEPAQFGHAPLSLFDQSVQRRPADFRVRRRVEVFAVRLFDEALRSPVMVGRRRRVRRRPLHRLIRRLRPLVGSAAHCCSAVVRRFRRRGR